MQGKKNRKTKAKKKTGLKSQQYKNKTKLQDSITRLRLSKLKTQQKTNSTSAENRQKLKHKQQESTLKSQINPTEKRSRFDCSYIEFKATAQHSKTATRKLRDSEQRTKLQD